MFAEADGVVVKGWAADAAVPVKAGLAVAVVYPVWALDRESVHVGYVDGAMFPVSVLDTMFQAADVRLLVGAAEVVALVMMNVHVTGYVDPLYAPNVGVFAVAKGVVVAGWAGDTEELV